MHMLLYICNKKEATTQGGLIMKTLKRAKQKSFSIDMDMYNRMQYEEMLESGDGIFYVGWDNPSHSVDEYDGEDLRINHSSVEEVKVVYNKEFGEYMNVVKTYSGHTYYVTL